MYIIQLERSSLLCVLGCGEKGASICLFGRVCCAISYCLSRIIGKGIASRGENNSIVLNRNMDKLLYS